jgi:predicted MFS family arabinose efflux permease
MVTTGVLNDIVQSLQVSVAIAGQLVGAAALVMAIGSPLLAALLTGMDRRRVLVLALLWYAAGHAACALAPGFGWLLVLRCVCMLGAAAFTPQAAAAIAALTPPEQRGRAITFVFLGWSVASVLGMPMAALIGEALGWRWALAAVALLALLAAAGVWRALPAGMQAAPLSLADWRSVLTHPLLMALVAVTALSASGQFVLFSYLAPYFSQVLGAGGGAISLLFFWFGAVGLVGNVLVSRHIDRLGAANAATLGVASMALSMLLWPLAGSVTAMLVVCLPWALGCFASNSAQQARLAIAAPALATALISLNSSAMYTGQFVGAGIGGVIIASAGYDGLHWAAFVLLAGAVAVSVWAAQRMRGAVHV